MSKIAELKIQIQELQNKAWQYEPIEQRAPLHEIIMFYDELLILGDDPYFIYDNKAKIHFQLKEYAKAETCLFNMLETIPESISALWLLAQVYFEDHQYEKALASFDKCIAHSFGSDFRYELRAKINRALGNLDAAAADQKVYDDYQAAEQAKWDDPNHYYHYK